MAMSALLLLANTALSGPAADYEKSLRDAHADTPAARHFSNNFSCRQAPTFGWDKTASGKSRRNPCEKDQCTSG